MVKDIPFDGLTTTPDDFISPDGHLATSFNLINEEGHLVPLPQPSTLFQLNADTNEQVVCLHTTSSYKRYILIDNTGMLSYIDAADPSFSRHTIHQFNSATSVLRCQPIDNTLCILADNGLHYILWQQVSYTYLGQKPPQLDISFSLKYHELNERDYWNNGASLIDNRTIEIQDDYGLWAASTNNIDYNLRTTSVQREVTNAVWAVINRVNATIADKGDFYAPFYIRYCYRLFDNSCIMHSAPILLARSLTDVYRITSSLSTQENTGTHNFSPTSNSTSWFTYNNKSASLYYSCPNISSFINAIKPWSDIIKSVDFFISAPITPYLPNDNYIKACTYSSPTMTLHIPKQKDYDYFRALQDMSPLYLIASLAIPSSEELLSSINEGEGQYLISSDRIEAPKTADFLVTQEVMPDDFKTHNIIMPTTSSPSLTYNSRLHIAEVNESLFSGFSPDCLLQQESSNNGKIVIDIISITIAANDGNHTVNLYSPSNKYTKELLASRPLFYPDSRAKELTLYFHRTISGYEGRHFKTTLQMMPCPLINGATTIFNPNAELGNSTLLPETEIESLPILIPDPVIVPDTGKVYTSALNNPFLFPDINRYTVGSGHILGLATTTQALSQGQFGQFPLYAFTSDGIWALSVSSSGTFSSVQPVSRDVCINANSITPIDNSVIFVSSRGIMQIAGSHVTCISSDIAAPTFNISQLPYADRLLSPFHPTPAYNQSLSSLLSDVQIIFDYAGQHLIVFTPRLSFAYVYSLKSKRWGSMVAPFSRALYSYPEALCVTSDNCLASFSPSSTPDNTTSCLLISRPIKFNSLNTLKQINSAVIRGRFSNIKTILFGSRDMLHWHLITSSTNHHLTGIMGSPYKYFRIAILADLSDAEFLDSLAVDIIASNNKL